MRTILCLLGFALLVSTARADTAPVSARELADRLADAQKGSSYVRFTMQITDHPGNPKGSLQLQVKQRRVNGESDVLYQVLWPKERKGESVLLQKKSGGAASGWILVPPQRPRSLTTAQMSEPLFGSALCYDDVVDDDYSWENQALAGEETVRNVKCVILESKPGGTGGIYARVRSWIDPRRMVPLRIEKYSSPTRLERRIEVTRVAADDRGRPVPADMTVTDRAGGVTELVGSRIRHDVTYSDHDFTPDGMATLSIPHS